MVLLVTRELLLLWLLAVLVIRMSYWTTHGSKIVRWDPLVTFDFIISFNFYNHINLILFTIMEESNDRVFIYLTQLYE